MGKDIRARVLAGETLHPETLMMGFGYDPHLSEGAIKPPLFQTSTFTFKSAEDGKRFFEIAYNLREREPDEAFGLIYSRINNPNLEILEERLALWDAADRALVFSSGMAAISTTMLALCRPGDRIAHSSPAYGGSEYLFERILPRYGILADPIAAGDSAAAWRESLIDSAAKARGNGGRLAVVHLETPANPTNELADIRTVADILATLGQEQRPYLTVDNTFLGPLWQKPLRVGADLVLYSLTKYVGGHSDLIAGGCLGSSHLIARVGEMRTISGTGADPHTAWLLLRSLETLHLRMERSAANATAVAEYLRSHPKVTAVMFPGGTGSEPEQLEIYRRQCTGPGSTLSVCLDGGEAEAFRFLNRLRLFHLAVSLGGTESLASHPSSTTHSDYSAADKMRWGITDNLVRLSVGVENVRDLIVDLRQALSD